MIIIFAHLQHMIQLDPWWFLQTLMTNFHWNLLLHKCMDYMAVLTSPPGCATHWKYLSWQAYRLLFCRNWADPKTSELHRKICRGGNLRADSAEKSKMQDWKDDRSAQREGCSHTYFASSLLRKADWQEKHKMCHWASSGSQSSSSLIDWQENYEQVLH